MLSRFCPLARAPSARPQLTRVRFAGALSTASETLKRWPVLPLHSRSPPNTEASQASSRQLNPHELLLRFSRSRGSDPVPLHQVEDLLAWAVDHLSHLPGPLLRLEVPQGPDAKIVVVGDTHGQLADLIHILHHQGPPSESCAYVFLGDIADRGSQATEIWLLALAFKLMFPEHVHILRGNHENQEMNERPRRVGGGFLEEVLAKYGSAVYSRFQEIFKLLPLFAVVAEEVFLVHAGLFRQEGVTLEHLEQLPYRHHYPTADRDISTWTREEVLLFDAQWSDPHNGDGIAPSRRGKSTIKFGRNITEEFLRENGLSLCIRSHEVPRTLRGFDLTHDDQLLTVFSASNYGGKAKNPGAIAVLRAGASDEALEDCALHFQLPSGLHVQCVEHKRPMAERRQRINAS